jgi:hypothetical protein
MADRQDIGAASGVNPADILDFVEASLRVVARADIGAVELRVMERGEPVVAVVMAPRQALALRDALLLEAVEAACGAAEREAGK